MESVISGCTVLFPSSSLPGNELCSGDLSLSSGGDRSGQTENMRSQIAARGTRNATGAAEENRTTGDKQTCEFNYLPNASY
jgi:hypothetical protein